MKRITRNDAISMAQSYTTLTGRKWKEDRNEVGMLTIDENDSGIELIEITNKGGAERSVFGFGFESPKNFYLHTSMAKQGILDYRLSPIFIEHALENAYSSASTPALKQSVIELVKDNIAQRCKRFIEGEDKFETFGYAFMRLLHKDPDSRSETEYILTVVKKFTVKIGENTFSFSRNDTGAYEVTATIPPKETFTWTIE